VPGWSLGQLEPTAQGRFDVIEKSVEKMDVFLARRGVAESRAEKCESNKPRFSKNANKIPSWTEFFELAHA
jgi:hypothetical protein